MDLDSCGAALGSTVTVEPAESPEDSGARVDAGAALVEAEGSGAWEEVALWLGAAMLGSFEVEGAADSAGS
ncbi:hypothetical protein AUR04nite_34240 [Glutamicibacter uratoxydans]|uniref:Uncharacterized protein n=1 Tax=Glutamicibacter uratoxydans TaxID=43667 RepID=A0A4Y4DRC3_GLUUR|nr:hypothetical protein AUR04nite_34240 [Glutamicibacter uratoxydans]